MKIYHRLMKMIGALDMLVLMASVVLVTLQIFFRYVLRAPLGWTEQICRLMFIWGIMLGIPVVFYEKRDLVFDILFQKFPPKLQRALTFIFILVTIVFCGFYFCCGVDLCIKTGNRMTSGVRMPTNLLYFAQPVCAFLMCLVFVERLISFFKREEPAKEAK